jgi:hypothetical protein
LERSKRKQEIIAGPPTALPARCGGGGGKSNMRGGKSEQKSSKTLGLLRFGSGTATLQEIFLENAMQHFDR